MNQAEPTSSPTASPAQLAAIALVAREGGVERVLARAQSLRLQALVCVTAAVLAFLGCTLLGRALADWCREPLVDETSMPLAQLADRHTWLFNAGHLVLGLIAVVGILLYAIQHVRFLRARARLPLKESASRKKVAPAALAFTVALLLTVVGVGAWVVGSLMPHRPAAGDYYRLALERTRAIAGINPVGATAEQQTEAIRRIQESEQAPGASAVPLYAEGSETLWELHIFWLPATFGALVFLLLVPVLSLQRAKLTADDIDRAPGSRPAP